MCHTSVAGVNQTDLSWCSLRSITSSFAHGDQHAQFWRLPPWYSFTAVSTRSSFWNTAVINSRDVRYHPLTHQRRPAESHELNKERDYNAIGTQLTRNVSVATSSRDPGLNSTFLDKRSAQQAMPMFTQAEAGTSPALSTGQFPVLVYVTRDICHLSQQPS